MINSFGQLEELVLFYLGRYEEPHKRWAAFNLNLPMLNSTQLDSVFSIEKMTLDAPRLQKSIWIRIPIVSLRSSNKSKHSAVRI